MIDTLVSIWLFAFGVLALAGYWRISRALSAQAAQTAAIGERTTRTEVALSFVGASVERLQGSIHAQRGEADSLRGKLTDFIDGPPSMRRPPAGPPCLALDVAH